MPDDLVSEGLMAPKRDRSDAEILETLIKLGVAPAAADAAVRRGDPESAVFEPVLSKTRAMRTFTPLDIEARGGATAAECAVLMQAFGLPPPEPDEPTFTQTEADVLVQLRGLRHVWTQEMMIQLARVYGEMLSRIAGSEAQAFWAYTVPFVRQSDPDPTAELEALHAAFESLLPLADPLLVGIHHRWVEHEMGQAAVRDAEIRAGGELLPGAAEVAFLFCDLKDFTRYAEIEGDRAAIAAIDRFFDVISRERGDSGRLIKSLGDGAMLAYPGPSAAVGAGGRIITAMKTDALPGVHASVHYGVAVAREGDYFGSAVNLAARLLALGGRDELITTGVVVDATGSEFSWEPMGEKSIRGVAEPIPIYRLLP